MIVEEPVRYVGSLLGRTPYRNSEWNLVVYSTRTLKLLKLVEPYLLGDKWESARYVLNIGRSVPDTECRPMYIGVIAKRHRPVHLYPEYVDFPIRYSLVVRRGELLPKPIRKYFPVKYTPEGRPIIWHEGLVM